ncbi:MAG: aminotransferase class I/II-fold pyridoxal phosphate-dependent enzyme [Proteobacteria bacterium]|nr:aminotransferase class I/II-fold pyridoxal phosphate-dependent enzyme [Pseudomonadota bacterium]
MIGDEVFHEYGWSDQPQVRITTAPEVLSFHLGGLSKLIGLPQLKLGWIAVAGPRAQRQAALRRLEIIADTYLSVGAPVQLAAARLLALGLPVQQALRARVRANRAWLLDHLWQTGAPMTLLEGAGGWSGVLRLPAPRGEEALVLELLERERVVVHPGYFFDFDGGGSHVIVSLLVPPETLRAGVAAIERVLAAG